MDNIGDRRTPMLPGSVCSEVPYLAIGSQSIGSWEADAEELPFQPARTLIIHHIGLVSLVLGCSNAQSLFIKACVTAVALLWIMAPYLLMRLDKRHNPYKYTLWNEVAIDQRRADLGVHRFFVSQDENGDMIGGVEGIMSSMVRNVEPLGVKGFQAMLGHSVQLYQLHLAVLLFCVADMIAMGPTFTGGDVERTHGDDSLPFTMRILLMMPIHAIDKLVETRGMLCGVLLCGAFSIRVPTALAAQVHSLRGKALKRWPVSSAMRERTDTLTFRKIDKSHKAFRSSFEYLAACRGLPLFLEAVRVVGYSCANGDGCHTPQIFNDPYTFVSLSALLFGLVQLLTMFTAHDWVILEFMRAARYSIYRLQILTQELRVAINEFDDLTLTSVQRDHDEVHEPDYTKIVPERAGRKAARFIWEAVGKVSSLVSAATVAVAAVVVAGTALMVAATALVVAATALDDIPSLPAAAVAVVAVAVAGTALVVAATALALDASVIAAAAAALAAAAVAIAVTAAALDTCLDSSIDSDDGASETEPAARVGVDVQGIDTNKASTLIDSLRAWLHTRIFMQQHDISFFFKSVSTQVGLLILCMAGCVVRVLLHLFDVVVFAEFPTYVGLVLVGLWCLCIVYFQAYYILKMDLTKKEQLRLLRQLMLSLSVKVKSNDETSKQVKVDTVRLVLDHVLNHDEPPTLLGVRVDRTLINLLHKSVAVTIAGWALSAISKRFF